MKKLPRESKQSSGGVNPVRHRKGAARSTLDLLLLQGSSVLAALLATPFLVATAGLDAYGRYAWTLGLVGFLALLADFGMSVNGTQAISGKRDRADWAGAKVTVVARTLGAAVLTSALLVTAALAPINGTNRDLLLASLPAVLAAGLSPLWLQQGLQDLRFLALTTAAGRAAWLLFAFWMTHGPDDLPLVLMADGLITLTISAITLFRSRRLWNDSPHVEWKSMLPAVRDGSPFLISQASSYLYTGFAVVIVGLVSNPSQTAIISIADRISGAAKKLLAIPLQAVMPATQQRRQEDSDWRTSERRGILLTLILASIASATSVLVLSLAWNLLFPNVQRHEQIPAILLLMAIPFVAVSYSAGITTLSGLGYSRSVARLQLAIAFGVQLPLIVAAHQLGAVGAAATVLTCEALLAFLLLTRAKRVL